jgi:hypothetical protein
MGRRIAEREANIRKQVEADRSPLEKVAGALEAVRFMGSALTQSINSMPTRIAKGDEAADKFMQERIYKPTQPTAYEYAQDIGDFLERLETEYKLPPVLPEALALQYLSGPAMSQASQAAGRGGMALEKALDPAVTGALERGGLSRDLLTGLAQGSRSNVVKPTGGNWLNRTVENELLPLRQKVGYSLDPEAQLKKLSAKYTPETIASLEPNARADVQRMLKETADSAALNKWIDSNLTNYVKKQMATPEDPVRKLAEQNITAFPIAEDPRFWNRMGEAGRGQMEGTQMAQSDLAKQWENRSDSMILSDAAQKHQDMMHLAPGMYEKADEFIKKLPPETPLYKTQGAGTRFNPRDLGFDHIIDVLKQDVAAGRIRPDQLNKVSMEQAVRRTHEFDQEMAKRMREAAIKQTEGFPTHKEYPEGYRWIELAKPQVASEIPPTHALEAYESKLHGGTGYRVRNKETGMAGEGFKTPERATQEFLKTHAEDTLADALKYEGDTMGHCVGGYCPDVLSGDTRIFSLRDAKGEPHVTVEVGKAQGRTNYDDMQNIYNQAQQEANEKNFPTTWEFNNFYNDRVKELQFALIDKQKAELPERIIQIKGKQNAKPKEDYLPYVQDFVRSGNWSDVGDFKNTGFEWHTTGPQGIFMQDDVKALEQAGYKVPKYLTTAEKDDFARKLYEMQTGNDYDTGLPKAQTPPPDLEGMKRGGVVSISNNPDTMMLELGNKRMKEGGSEDDTKPYFGGAGTKKYAAAKKRAEEADVNLLKDPKTYAAMASFMGEAPDQLGFSVLHPDYEGIRKVADPAFGLGIAAQVAPIVGPMTKGLPVGASIKDVTPMKASEALGKIEGRPLKITQADRTKVGGGFLGGPGFSGLQLTEPEYRAAEAAWAVQNAGTAKTILGGGADNAVYAAMLGTPTQHQSNQMVWDKMYGAFLKAAKRGELDPELRDKINFRLASAVDKKGNPVFPSDVDILDKNFRKIANTFDRRSIAGHLMGGVQVGGKKGQIIDYDKIIRSTTDPVLIDQPTGAIGNRLFTLSGGIVNRPDLHPAFPTILQGEDLGVMFTPVERDIVMKDFVEKTMREKGRKPGYMDYTRGNPPTQLITEDILTELQKLGKKKGGAVKKAEGGAITGDDLIIEERPL